MGSDNTSTRFSARPSKRWAMPLVCAALLLWLVAVLAGCGGNATLSDGGTVSPVAPTPGGTFSGPIEITGAASSAAISLVVSADGASITSVGVNLTDLKTETFSAGSMEKQVSGTIPVKEGKFTGSLSGLGDIEGRFTSAAEASGTVRLNLEIPFSAPADLGEFDWTATVR